MAEHILVVDDSLLVRQMLAQQLGALGYSDVSKAVNGTDAMEQMVAAHEKNHPFRIVFLDWNMPSMNGFEFLTKCRNDPRFAKTAIVMAAAEREENNIIKALEAGATGYLIKPYSAQALEETLNQVTQWLASAAMDSKATPHG